MLQSKSNTKSRSSARSRLAAKGRYSRQITLTGRPFPRVATKLTQSPWFLKTPYDFQPPFLHWSAEVGAAGVNVTGVGTSGCRGLP